MLLLLLLLLDTEALEVRNDAFIAREPGEPQNPQRSRR